MVEYYSIYINNLYVKKLLSERSGCLKVAAAVCPAGRDLLKSEGDGPGDRRRVAEY